MSSKSVATALILVSATLTGTASADVDLADISLPPGFVITEYADVENARSLAAGADGVVFVSNRQGDSVFALVPQGDRARAVKIDDDLETPNGIAFHEGDLYVAEVERVLVYRDIMDALRDPPEPEELDIELPSESHHGWRYIDFGPDGELYIAIGAPCNICERDGFAQIVRMNPDGTGRETVAQGVRNSVGFTWHPATGELWFTDNGRDMLGDTIPGDELNRVRTAGEHFGYPYCHQGDLPDPEFGAKRPCGDFRAPAQVLGAHHGALGIAFYTGDNFPEEYRGQLFIAEHGSWNRTEKAGYRVALVRFDGDRAVSYETFAEGWLDGQQTLGRPVDVLVHVDGSLLVSDDEADKVYRIRYEGPAAAP
jgi:glucose/arabinose dehydrogenase